MATTVGITTRHVSGTMDKARTVTSITQVLLIHSYSVVENNGTVIAPSVAQTSNTPHQTFFYSYSDAQKIQWRNL